MGSTPSWRGSSHGVARPARCEPRPARPAKERRVRKARAMRDASRRDVLRLAALAAAGLALRPRSLWAALQPTRTLALFNVHTRESLEVEYCVGDCYQPEQLRRFDYLLRD